MTSSGQSWQLGLHKRVENQYFRRDSVFPRLPNDAVRHFPLYPVDNLWISVLPVLSSELLIVHAYGGFLGGISDGRQVTFYRDGRIFDVCTVTLQSAGTENAHGTILPNHRLDDVCHAIYPVKSACANFGCCRSRPNPLLAECSYVRRSCRTVTYSVVDTYVLASARIANTSASVVSRWSFQSTIISLLWKGV